MVQSDEQERNNFLNLITPDESTISNFENEFNNKLKDIDVHLRKDLRALLNRFLDQSYIVSQHYRKKDFTLNEAFNIYKTLEGHSAPVNYLLRWDSYRIGTLAQFI